MSGRSLFDALQRVWYRQQPPGPFVLERHVRPSMEQFAAIRRAGTPVLLDGIASAGAITLADLKTRFGDRRLPVLSTDDGRLTVDVDKGVAFDTVRFGDYVDRLTSGAPMDTYLASPLDTWLPELKADLPPPQYCRDAPWQNTRLWLSKPDTRVPLHRDVAQNIFFQLVGRKRFLLYPPAAAPWLYSNPIRSALANYSQCDPEHPDYERFPLSRLVQPVEVVLQPGDVMYLPSRWWHQVRSLDVSLSLTFWWADGAIALAVRAAEFVKRVRGLEIYGLERKLRGGGERVVGAGHAGG